MLAPSLVRGKNGQMRPIEPMNLPDVSTRSASGCRPTFRNVDPRALLVDEGYQRALSDRSVRLIRKIVGEWSWLAFKPPVVTEADGEMHVIDGQHTAIAAASHPLIDTIPVMIVATDTQASRADSFVRHNRDRITVSAIDLHFAMVAAGDEDAMTVAQVCEKAGVRIIKNPSVAGRYKVGETLAIRRINILVSRRHAMGARRVLEIAVKGGAAPVSANLIQAIEHLIFAEEYRDQVPDSDIVSVLLAGDLEVEAQRFATERKLPLWRALASVIFMRRRRRRG